MSSTNTGSPPGSGATTGNPRKDQSPGHRRHRYRPLAGWGAAMRRRSPSSSRMDALDAAGLFLDEAAWLSSISASDRPVATISRIRFPRRTGIARACGPGYRHPFHYQPTMFPASSRSGTLRRNHQRNSPSARRTRVSPSTDRPFFTAARHSATIRDRSSG